MLTQKQIKLVEDSWDYVILNINEAGEIFYNRLFEVAPHLKLLFKEDIKSQAQKLISLISFAVHKLNNLNEIISDVKSLGVRHKKYNVKPEHYAVVGESLLWTLERGLKEKWNNELKDAWIAVYGQLSTVMIEAAKES